jgi:hypothetical protein
MKKVVITLKGVIRRLIILGRSRELEITEGRERRASGGVEAG